MDSAQSLEMKALMDLGGKEFLLPELEPCRPQSSSVFGSLTGQGPSFGCQ